tara:strand:+ start:1230 stop:1661 length:432 start_codon:yes stop_codon:yes gene_type:complete
MFNLFKKNQDDKENNLSLIAIACLLVHSAKIDENFTDNERKIIKKALIELGAQTEKVDEIIKDAEEKEKDSNQILEFTREIKNVDKNKKEVIIETLWHIIYSDKNADMYETNLMRRISGLLYLDNKVVGNIKEKIKKKNDILS